MTGFKLTWNIQNEHPPIHMELKTKGLGSGLTTPGFGQQFDGDFLKNNQNFKLSLLITKDLLLQMGQGHLVLEIHMSKVNETNRRRR